MRFTGFIIDAAILILGLTLVQASVSGSQGVGSAEQSANLESVTEEMAENNVAPSETSAVIPAAGNETGAQNQPATELTSAWNVPAEQSTEAPQVTVDNSPALDEEGDESLTLPPCLECPEPEPGPEPPPVEIPPCQFIVGVPLGDECFPIPDPCSPFFENPKLMRPYCILE